MYDGCLTIETMPHGSRAKAYDGLRINYSFATTQFGDVVIASTSKGICYLAFAQDPDQAIITLHNRFPGATYKQQQDDEQIKALSVFAADHQAAAASAVKLHLHGTDFQIKVWRGLLDIPVGSVWSYGDIAQHINQPKASRAVGSAIGKNPIAFLVPCHRVIRKDGHIGGYLWGLDRKKSMLTWEETRAA